MKNIKQIMKWIVISETVGISGAIFTSPAIPTWFIFLNKPVFSPPNWLFGPVWTLLYAMMGLAFGIILSTETKQAKAKAKQFFYIQLTLNFLWSVLFFGAKLPLFAFGEIVMLWVAIIFCIAEFLKINRTAGYLLVPYLLWVSFASILNLAIAVLN
jgi:tryptophan-rich sensory protein